MVLTSWPSRALHTHHLSAGVCLRTQVVLSVSWGGPSPTPMLIASSGLDRKLFMLDASTWSAVKGLAFPSAVNKSEFSPQGTLLATSAHGMIHVWTVPDLSLMASFSPSRSSDISISWDPTGRFLATTSDDMCPVVYDTSSGQFVEISGLCDRRRRFSAICQNEPT